MGMTSAGNHTAHSTINVTPLIDVLLVLLIIFMVIQPSVAHGLDALAPHPPDRASTEPNPHTVVVQLARSPDGRLLCRLNQGEVPPAALPAALQRLFAQRADHTLFVQAAPDLDYQPVLAVLDAGHAAGIHNIGLITPPTLVRQ